MRTSFIFTCLVIGILVCATTGWTATVAGDETVALTRIRLTTEYEWALYVSGASAGLRALGGLCAVPGSVGETAAYLRFTADGRKSVAQALRDEWDRRGCKLDTTTAKSEFYDELVEIRSSSDIKLLRSIVEIREGLYSILASDRLRELGYALQEVKPSQ